MGFQMIRVKLDQPGNQVIAVAIDSGNRGIRGRIKRLADLLYKAVHHANTAVNYRLCQHDMRVSENLLCRCIHALTLGWIS